MPAFTCHKIICCFNLCSMILVSFYSLSRGENPVIIRPVLVLRIAEPTTQQVIGEVTTGPDDTTTDSQVTVETSSVDMATVNSVLSEESTAITMETSTYRNVLTTTESITADLTDTSSHVGEPFDEHSMHARGIVVEICLSFFL